MTMRACGLLFGVLVLGLGGCSGSDKPKPSLADRCIALCERFQAADCPDAPPTTDCSAVCNGAADSVEATGCTVAYSAALSCSEDNAACDLDSCSTENEAWLACVQCAPADEDAGSEDAGSDDDAGTCN